MPDTGPQRRPGEDPGPHPRTVTFNIILLNNTSLLHPFPLLSELFWAFITCGGLSHFCNFFPVTLLLMQLVQSRGWGWHDTRHLVLSFMSGHWPSKSNMIKIIWKFRNLHKAYKRFSWMEYIQRRSNMIWIVYIFILKKNCFIVFAIKIQLENKVSKFEIFFLCSIYLHCQFLRIFHCVASV